MYIQRALVDAVRKASATFPVMLVTGIASFMNGRFRVKRKTSKKKYNASLKKVRVWLWEQLTTPARDVMEKLAVN